MNGLSIMVDIPPRQPVQSFSVPTRPSMGKKSDNRGAGPFRETVSALRFCNRTQRCSGQAHTRVYLCALVPGFLLQAKMWTFLRSLINIAKYLYTRILPVCFLPPPISLSTMAPIFKIFKCNCLKKKNPILT